MCTPFKKPPFLLEPLKRPSYKTDPQTLYTKGEYSPKIKITNWEHREESLPLDINPYEPGKLNFHLSHYKRLGFGPDAPWLSETHATWQQLRLKDKLDELYRMKKKYMVNYYSYKDTLPCEMDIINRQCVPLCAESYSTTMQMSYTPPYPYIMQRFALPKIPRMKYRACKFDTNDPKMSPTMFMDDRYKQQVCTAQKNKEGAFKSYNFCTYENTDGTIPKERKLGCYKLDYMENRK